jgi:predicted Zn-dependent protease
MGLPGALALVLAGCATNPSGRSQMLLIGDAQVNQMGLTAFNQMKASDKLSNDPAKQRYAECVTRAIVAQLDPSWRQLPWEVAVFNHTAANAFALPGGKVGVHTGMLKLATTQDELAAVIGHEIAHVTHRHGAERISQGMAAEVALAATQAYVGRKQSPEEARMALALLGVGAQIGVMLPFSRLHESEADVAGQALMARAGFDPQAAVSLWDKMHAENPARAPQWLSTHPDPERRRDRLTTRVEALRASRDAAMPSPACTVP